MHNNFQDQEDQQQQEKKIKACQSSEDKVIIHCFQIIDLLVFLVSELFLVLRFFFFTLKLLIFKILRSMALLHQILFCVCSESVILILNQFFFIFLFYRFPIWISKILINASMFFSLFIDTCIDYFNVSSCFCLLSFWGFCCHGW